MATVPSPKFDENEMAAWLKVSPLTLRSWRARKKGPPYRKAGRRVIYDLGEAEAWLVANRRNAAPATGRGYLA